MSLNATSRRTALKLLGAGAAMSAFGTGTAVASSSGKSVFEFESMVGNTLTGEAGSIRGIGAGGLPWVVDEAEVRLDRDGELRVKVEGLVIDPDVDHPLAGTNPVSEFRAILSCLQPDTDSNEHVIDDVQTDTFPATEDGDSEIREKVDVPEPCLAPIVFVTSPGGSWFAVTGL